ncbi:dipeptide ABC transporter ATP-binding protein [Kribbella sp. NPDC056951]|uniref:dipeptide ABC transporter ATP-binding protein n=1 Tax=Kribbella sp. NPDC056951 TaxID=3345978 RepID=UPI00363B8AB6
MSIDVQNLSVSFGRGRSAKQVVRGISFAVEQGEALALVGESGSGKSVTARTLVGLTGTGSTVTADRLTFEGADLRGFGAKDWRRLRGGRIGFVLQDALASLDGLRPVGKEIAEPLALHTQLTKAERQLKVVDLLAAVGVPEPELRARQFPHELSGGLRQRALIASAIGTSPSFLIADEPTTALDTTVQAQILELLKSLKSSQTSMLVVSHDLAVVAQIAERIAVMRHGEIVETGTVDEVLGNPRHPYTQSLLDSVPSRRSRGRRLTSTATAAEPVRREPGKVVVEARDLVKKFTGPDHVSRTVVDQVSFELRAGETLGLVGESGSGKTTTARIALGIETPDGGEVLVNGVSWSSLRGLDRRKAHRNLQVIYQDPLSSFDPRFTVGRVLDEAIAAGGASRRTRRDRAGELLELVQLNGDFLKRRPIEMSGGERQRVAIARALASEPQVVVCDEPVSALDVSVQAQILDLLRDVQDQLGVAYLFISHDLGVVHHLADRVIVLRDGQVVEAGEIEQVFTEPRHEYTRDLLSAIPALGARTQGVVAHA